MFIPPHRPKKRSDCQMNMDGRISSDTSPFTKYLIEMKLTALRLELGGPSLHLKESLKAVFFLALGGLELSDLLFSIEGAVLVLRQGKQLLCRIPQLSNILSSFPALPSTEDDISSRNTGCLASVEFLPSSLTEFRAEPTSCECLPIDVRSKPP